MLRAVARAPGGSRSASSAPSRRSSRAGSPAGGPPIVHWQGVPTREGRAAPLIEGALGWIEAETRAEHDAGDHTFFIADVLAVEHGPSDRALVYRETTYHSV